MKGKTRLIISFALFSTLSCLNTVSPTVWSNIKQKAKSTYQTAKHNLKISELRQKFASSNYKRTKRHRNNASVLLLFAKESLFKAQKNFETSEIHFTNVNEICKQRVEELNMAYEELENSHNPLEKKLMLEPALEQTQKAITKLERIKTKTAKKFSNSYKLLKQKEKNLLKKQLLFDKTEKRLTKAKNNLLRIIAKYSTIVEDFSPAVEEEIEIATTEENVPTEIPENTAV